MQSLDCDVVSSEIERPSLSQYNIPCEIANPPGILLDHDAVYKRARLAIRKNKSCERRALSLSGMMMASINIVRVVVVVRMMVAARGGRGVEHDSSETQRRKSAIANGTGPQRRREEESAAGCQQASKSETCFGRAS